MRPYNAGSRTELADSKDEKLRPDRIVAQTWESNGYVDAALHLYDQTGDQDLLHRTSHSDRIDQFWVSSPLASGLVRYERACKPSGASDHDGVVICIDTDKVDTGNVWEYR
jgi:hypothetical protein